MGVGERFLHTLAFYKWSIHFYIIFFQSREIFRYIELEITPGGQRFPDQISVLPTKCWNDEKRCMKKRKFQHIKLSLKDPKIILVEFHLQFKYIVSNDLWNNSNNNNNNIINKDLINVSNNSSLQYKVN